MAYPTYDPIETEKVAWVHGLTGGELESRPLRILVRTYDPGIPSLAARYPDLAPRYTIRRAWARFWYEGAPEYASREFRDASGRGSIRTLVWDSGAYGNYRPPQAFRDSAGRRWRKVGAYTSACEMSCPVPENHPGKVTRAEAKSMPPNPYRANPKRRHAECPMCEARIGDEHGVIYLGEGWIEAVYYSPDPKEEVWP